MSYFPPSLLVLDETSGVKSENSATTSSADSWVTDFSHFGIQEMCAEFPTDSVMLNPCYRFTSESSSKRSILKPVINESVKHAVPTSENEISKYTLGYPHHTDFKSTLISFNDSQINESETTQSENYLLNECDTDNDVLCTDNEHSTGMDKCYVRRESSTLGGEKLCKKSVDDNRQPKQKNRLSRHKFRNSTQRTNLVSNYPLVYDGSQQPFKMKTKLKYLWENMKYGWRVKQQTSFNSDSPIWLLGKYYHTRLDDSQGQSSCGGHKPEDFSKASFKKDLSSLIWLTYRYNFPALGDNSFTTDSGWGCMIRAGQMIMAQGLVCHLLGRDWHLSEDEVILSHHRNIVRWFADSPSIHFPFSIHKLVTVGISFGKNAGEWYGPAHIIHVLREALIQESKRNSELKNLCIYVTPDGIVFKQDIVDLCTSHPEHLLNDCKNSYNSKNVCYSPVSVSTVQLAESIDVEKCNTADLAEITRGTKVRSEQDNVPLKKHHFECVKDSSSKTSSLCEDLQSSSFDENCRLQSGKLNISLPLENVPPLSNSVWKSVIIFIAVRLGNDRMNPFYIPSMKSLLAYEHCIGIIGGRPRHAVYFVGWHGNKLIHLDPHFCQAAEDFTDPNCKFKSYYCSSPCTMSFSDMDPSCAIGFYLKTKSEFEEFFEKIIEMSTAVKRNMEYPIFALSEGRRSDAEASCMLPQNYSAPNLASCHVGEATTEQDDDGYIVL